MIIALLIAIVVLIAVALVLQVIQLKRGVDVDLSPVSTMFNSVERAHERTERSVRESLAENRNEATLNSKTSRDEIGATLRTMGETTNKQLGELTKSNEVKLDKMREEGSASIQKVREEITNALTTFATNLAKAMEEFGSAQRTQLGNVNDQLLKLMEASEKRMEAVKLTVEEKLKALQEDNGRSLEQMRQTVDEKLQGTLEKRLGESFKLVSERLEQVHKGLGEMQTLATGVGDLKRVLTNVKSRGTWGEVQLGALLEQVLSPDQFETNVAIKNSGERVEFAIKLPHRGEDTSEVLYLPIDAKFPVEDYQRLVEAQERADPEAAEAAGKQLEMRVKQCAKDICDKYISAPKTTDFAILFLPTEGLFAEVLRRTGLPEIIQRDCRVVIAGPTTLWSILNSLQMGFRTLAIQKRSSEVWKVLGAVKMEFGKYSDVLAKVQKKLNEASDTIDKEVGTRTRAIQRSLRDVEAIDAPAGSPLLTFSADGAVDMDDEKVAD